MPLQSISLHVKNTTDSFQISYSLPTIPVALLWLSVPFIMISVTVYSKGSDFGPLWLRIGVLLLAIAAIIGFLILTQKFLVKPLWPERLRLVYDKSQALLKIPVDNVTVPRADVLRVITIYGRHPDSKEGGTYGELSVLYRTTNGMFRSAVLLHNRWRAQRIAKMLAHILDVETVTIQSQTN